MIPTVRAASIVIFASLALTACASAPPAEPLQSPEAPPSLFGPSWRGTAPVDQQMLAIAKSEEEIDKLFPHAGKAPLPREKRGPRTDAATTKEPKAADM